MKRREAEPIREEVIKDRWGNVLDATTNDASFDYKEQIFVGRPSLDYPIRQEVRFSQLKSLRQSSSRRRWRGGGR